jgi:hypothetical protein
MTKRCYLTASVLVAACCLHSPVSAQRQETKLSVIIGQADDTAIVLQDTVYARDKWQAARRGPFANQPYSQIDTTGLNSSTSSFYHLEQAMLAARKADSVMVGRHFTKVSPHHLFFLGITPRTIDSFALTLRVPADVRKAYRKQFDAVYFTEKSPIYALLEQGYEKHKAAVAELDSFKGCRLEALEQKLGAIDSANFKTLYQYVQKNGWPSLEQGGLFAGQIAMYDYEHSDFYLTQFKTAVAAGELPLNYYKRLFVIDLWVQTRMDRTNSVARPYIVFDISQFLKGEIPYCIDAVRSAASGGNVKEVFVDFRTNKINQKNVYEPNQFDSRKLPELIRRRYNREIVPLGITSEGDNALSHFCRITDENRERLLLYVVYNVH